MHTTALKLFTSAELMDHVHQLLELIIILALLTKAVVICSNSQLFLLEHALQQICNTSITPKRIKLIADIIILHGQYSSKHRIFCVLFAKFSMNQLNVPWYMPAIFESDCMEKALSFHSDGPNQRGDPQGREPNLHLKVIRMVYRCGSVTNQSMERQAINWCSGCRLL